MSDHLLRRHLSRDAAERLLDGDPTAEPAGPLAAQLRAARAPALPAELAGEHAALVAFQAAAQLGHVPRQRRQSMLKIALAKLLTVKAAAVAAAGAGGIALAAGTGVLPVELPDTAPATPPAVNEAPATPSGAPTPTDRPEQAGGDPAPSMAGLCRAYAAEVSNNPGKALESPAFTALLTAAGGAGQVDGFCQKQSAAADQPGGGAPADLPTPAAADGKADSGADHAQVPTSRPQPQQPPAGPPATPPTGGPTT